MQSKNSGHWTALTRKKNKGKYIYEFFDSYGEPQDFHLDILNKKQRKEYDEEKDKLNELLRNKLVVYNNVRLQGPKTDTCGMFVTHRLHNYNKNLYQYVNSFLDKGVINPDEYVSNYVLKLLKKYNIE